MRHLIFIALVTLLAGCTQVVFVEPVGRVADKEAATAIPGKWMGEKGMVWTVEAGAEPASFVATAMDGDKKEEYRFQLRVVGKACYLIWVDDPKLKAFAPFRVSGGDASAVLLTPDEEAVKLMVEQGKLVGEYNKDKKTWVIAKGDWAALLESKEFWRLDSMMAFLKVQPTKDEAPAEKTVTPAARPD